MDEYKFCINVCFPHLKLKKWILKFESKNLNPKQNFSLIVFLRLLILLNLLNCSQVLLEDV